jgi:hypothetical protein
MPTFLGAGLRTFELVLDPPRTAGAPSVAAANPMPARNVRRGIPLLLGSFIYEAPQLGFVCALVGGHNMH